MSDPIYLIIKRIPCPRCQRYICPTCHKEWPRDEAEEQANWTNTMYCGHPFDEAGFPDRARCDLCRGTGTIDEEVTLQETLRAIMKSREDE